MPGSLDQRSCSLPQDLVIVASATAGGSSRESCVQFLVTESASSSVRDLILEIFNMAQLQHAGESGYHSEKIEAAV